jgi:hypothetical protein
MMLLDIPSVWDMTLCRRFMPDSKPVTGFGDAVPFDTLAADLVRTQDTLIAALTQVSRDKLEEIRAEKTIGGHLAFYNAHEAFHAGQLVCLRQVIGT